MSIPIDQMLEVIGGLLDEYASGITDEVKDAVKDVAKDTVREVKKRSPVRTGAYQKSWGKTTVRETPSSIVISVHNKKHYRLTHLLENGHALPGGGRTKAYPHIAPAERFAERELSRSIELKVRGSEK